MRIILSRWRRRKIVFGQEAAAAAALLAVVDAPALMVLVAVVLLLPSAVAVPFAAAARVVVVVVICVVVHYLMQCSVVLVWNASHSILSCPLPGKFIVFFPIGFVYSGDLRHQRIVGIGITQQRANRK